MRENVLSLLVGLLCGVPLWAAQQSAEAPFSSYKVLASELVDKRAHGVEESRAQQERVLHFLDEFVLARVNATPPVNLAEINAGLKQFVGSEPAVGEEYTLETFPERSPPVYALAYNLGLSGPAAVRLYEKKADRYELRLSIDQFADPDFDDTYLKALLFPPSGGELFLLTVSGRTDSWSTGTFTLWAISNGEARKAWVAEALPFSSYSLAGSELRLEFCDQQDEEKPEVCRQHVREVYTLANGEFRRTQHAAVPSAAPPK